jgi:hypothetical protein
LSGQSRVGGAQLQSLSHELPGHRNLPFLLRRMPLDDGDHRGDEGKDEQHR